MSQVRVAWRRWSPTVTRGWCCGAAARTGRGRGGCPAGTRSSARPCARSAEETGLTVTATARLGFTDDPMPEIGRHYVTLFVACTVLGGRARVMEPDKATELAWFTPSELHSRCHELFAPLRRFLGA